jgi:Bacterial Ig domain
VNGGPLDTIGVNAVLHLIAEDIYIDIKFITWTSVSGGGFAYERSTPALANMPPTVSIDSPTNGASFAASDNVTIRATAEDSDGSLTNVAFFDGGTFLGETNDMPYAFTTSLALGSHAPDPPQRRSTSPWPDICRRSGTVISPSCCNPSLPAWPRPPTPSARPAIATASSW